MNSFSSLIVKGFTLGPYPINGFLAYDRVSREAAFVDPGGYSPNIKEYIDANNISLKHILITHGHWDHVYGLHHFVEAFNCQTWTGTNELDGIDNYLNGGEIIAIGTLEIQCLSTPGHTANGISYYCDGHLFTGDALFAGSVGGTHGINNTRRQIKSVMDQIFTLSDETKIYPAHGPMSTVWTEKNYNPFFFKRLSTKR